MPLNNYQLILLDNLIYLKNITKMGLEDNKKRLVKNYIHELLSGGIDECWKDELKEDQSDDNPGQCLMKKEEWVAVLNAIAQDETLMNMTISNVVDTDSDPDSENTNFRAACFSNEEETVIVFRGTHGAYTWNDNGEGGYLADTNSQQEAALYVDQIGAELSTNKTITVTGHSKGGNLAQYVTICARNLVIDRCVSFDGQGFSNEFLEAHQTEILVNQDKLYSVNSAQDFVNPLLNTLVPEEHRMYVESNMADSLAVYHKPNNVFSMDENGTLNGLNSIANQGALANFINEFTRFIINYESDDMVKQQQKADTIDTLVGFVESGADLNDDKIGYFKVLLMNIFTCAVDKLVVCIEGMVVATGNFILAYECNEYIKENGTLFQQWQDCVQDDAKIENWKNAVSNLSEYIQAFFEQESLGEGRIALLLNEILCIKKNQAWEECIDYAINLESVQAVYKERMGIPEAVTLEAIYNVINSKYESDIADEMNKNYAKTNTLGEDYTQFANQYIIVSEGQETASSELTYSKGLSAVGNANNNTIIGNGGNNILDGGNGDDCLFGRNGQDTLYGGEGDDFLLGGKGDDILYGGAGNDIYVIESADGIDTIWESDSGNMDENIISFGLNINKNAIRYSRGEHLEGVTVEEYSNDLYIYYNGFPVGISAAMRIK